MTDDAPTLDARIIIEKLRADIRRAEHLATRAQKAAARADRALAARILELELFERDGVVPKRPSVLREVTVMWAHNNARRARMGR